MEVEIDLYEDWIAGNIAELQAAIQAGWYFKSHHDWQTKITAGDIIENAGTRERLLIINLIRKYRLIEPRPRALKLCSGLAVPDALRQGWRDFCEEVRNGSDLNRRLSRKSLVLDSQDEMLNHWGLQHFHLGVGPDPKYPTLIKGESEIAYAFVTPSIVYVIDIAEHGKWADLALLERLDLDFPEALAPYKTDALDISWVATEEDHKRLRKANINMMLKVNGKIFVEPGMGVMGDGTPSNIIFPMIQTKRRLKCADKIIRDNLDLILTSGAAEYQGKELSKKLTFILQGFTPRKVYVSCEELAFNVIVRPDGTWNIVQKCNY